jgi:NADH dehydrogenase
VRSSPGQANAEVILGEVTDIDLDRAGPSPRGARARSTVTPYDELIVAAGAGQSYFGNDHFADHAPGMKTIDDALELRGRIFGAFELAELAPTEAERAGCSPSSSSAPVPPVWRWPGRSPSWPTAPCATTSGDRPASARVVLLDAGPQVLPSFGENLGGQGPGRRLERWASRC